MQVTFVLISALVAYANCEFSDEDVDEEIEEMMDSICEDGDARKKTEMCVNSFPAHLYHSMTSCAGNSQMSAKDLLAYFCDLDDSAAGEEFDECIEKKSKEEIQSGDIRAQDVLAIAKGCTDIVKYGKDRGWDSLWEKLEASRKK